MSFKLPRAIVCVDFEFISTEGNRPIPVCMVAHELRTGQQWRLWADELGPRPPYPTGRDVLFVSFFASAELGCYRQLGWPMPERILDLFCEFRCRTNGLALAAGRGLIGALIYYGLDHIGHEEKRAMIDRILQGPPYSIEERTAILDYCMQDVTALQKLLPVMLPHIDMPRALLRGRYMAAVSAMEHAGTPIDVPTLELLRANWDGIKDDLIAEIDKDYGVYDGQTFKLDRFERYLIANNIPWPLLESGQLSLSDDTFRDMAKCFPAISPLRELRSALSELRLNQLRVGADGRNRCLLSTFGSKTGRNQPSNTKFIFGPSVWLRGLIKPPPGHGMAYVDWSQQEFGIAAALSGDTAMQDAYNSGDPYLSFAKQAGAVPPDATRASHKDKREQFKACVLGVQYGMGPMTLATRIGQPGIVGRDLLRAHQETYRDFWKWSDAAVDEAMLKGKLNTVFGWPVHVTADSNPRMLRNFCMQGNGSEMLRLACCLATERGIEIVAPVHDAVMVCAPVERLEADVAIMQTCMAEASRAVLAGFELNTDATLVRYPDRYCDPRGSVMWDRTMELARRHNSLMGAA